MPRRPALRVRRAGSTSGQVALLRVIEPGDFQHWLAVEERMREEAREHAERLLQGLAAEISQRVHIMPELMVREGTAFDEVLAQINEDPQLRVLCWARRPARRGRVRWSARWPGACPATCRFPSPWCRAI